MSETGPSTEEIGGVKQKDSRELIGQLTQPHHTKEADEVVEQAGYDNDKVKQRLQELTDNDPEEYKYFVYSLRRNIRENEKQVGEALDGFFSANPESEETRVKRKGLETRVIRNNEASPELAQELRELFPSGNYLVHGTSVEGALSVAGDGGGAIKSVAEIRKNDEKFKGKGGFLGVSFSYDGVRALPGTWRHMTMFSTSPEKALGDNKKLVVPYYAADRELQLVGTSYDRNLAVYVESTLDFYGLKNLIGGGGVISDFAEMESPYEYKKGETPIESDLNKLANGELKAEDVSSKYQVTDGKLSVVPDITEQDVSLGLMYSDYLLKHTPEGRELGKSIENATPQELLDLYNKTIYRGREIIADVERASEVLNDSMATSVDIEDTVMFVPEGDVDKWLNVFSRTEKAPKAFVAFSPQEGPRVPNWKLPEGDWEKAEQTIEKTLNMAGVQEPSIPFPQVTGKEITDNEIIGERIRHLKWDAIKDSQELVMENGQLKLQNHR